MTCQSLQTYDRSLATKLDARLAPIGELWSEVLNSSDVDLYFRDGEHASAIGDFLIAIVLTKVIAGKLPKESFKTAFDFTVSEQIQPVKENVQDEVVELEAAVISLIREQVGKGL